MDRPTRVAATRALAGVALVLALPARAEKSMAPYVETVPGVATTLEMVPIPGGTVLLGSPEGEAGRADDEGPRREVELAPFWMSTVEIQWDLYQAFAADAEVDAPGPDLAIDGATLEELDVDALARPTPPYVPMDFGMGVEGYPAIGMTQFAARQFTRWLSERTGRFYRLPTEAEWEHACRAGTTTAYWFGDDAGELPAHGWFRANSPDRRYHRSGELAPNPWGLHDMHGNVAEWVLDQHHERYPESLPAWPTTLYPRVVRGGSYLDDAGHLRCAARRASSPSWKRRDPQLPQSVWWHTDARFVGFRVVRPRREPSEEERRRAWSADVEEVRRVVERQRRQGH
ncbi:MAG TPA: formylglycine-generating enzyme family protein [Thermoanaerobaculia bacterium]|nr:formylglycine-generating enzyme family protein [Thermoanaerobaculia bacterium]